MDRQLRPSRQLQALSRREFLRIAASAGAVGAGVVLLGACRSDERNAGPTSTPESVADPPPETTTIRLAERSTTNLNVCAAPLLLAEPFLRAEGFTDVRYVGSGRQDAIGSAQQLAAGEIDMHAAYAATLTAAADAGDPLVMLAGMHNTCFELFGNSRVQSLRDLKGKRIRVQKADPADDAYAFMAALLAYVGVDLKNGVEFVELSSAVDVMNAWQAGTIDALLVPPPYSTIVRASGIGHTLLNGIIDAPWSQYFCCMVTANRDFAEKHPAATKRALRAILKATDLCAKEPERAARYLVDKGYPTYDDAFHEIAHLKYVWREFDPADSVRFFALRLKEAGLVKSTPDELIARAADWRYLNEIKRELAVS